MKKVNLSKARKPVVTAKTKNKVRKSPSRVELLKQNKLKKINSNSKLQRKKLKKKLGKIGLIVVGVIAIFGIIGGLVLMAYVQDVSKELPSPENVFPELPLTSEIYDRLALEDGGKGTRLYRIIGNLNSDQVNLEDIPDHVKLAFIAAEDKDFFIHGGFDPAGIIRCGLDYVRNSSGSCGGSTITQQLVKLTTDQSERSLERKLKEILLAMQVEQTYDKDQILEMYLRVASFGSSIVGIKTASNFYFGKEPKDLTVAEGTVLAAIVQNPVYLSPTVPLDGDTDRAIEDLKERQSYIFRQLGVYSDKFNTDLRNYYNDLEKDDVVNQEILQEAQEEDWVSSLRPPIATDKKAGHFVNYVMNLLQTRNYKNGEEPFTLNDLQTGGYKIYTTLDYGVQQVAEKYVAKGGNDYSFWNVHNAAMMTTIPGTGEIIAMAGSKSFYGKREGCDGNNQNCKYDPEVNVLTSLQEPGSSNKPLGYYLAYKEGKIFTGSLLPDIPIDIVSGGVSYEIRNWDGQYMGINYSANDALRDSRNLPAITVMQMVGVEPFAETARQFGYTTYTDDSQLGLSAILGGVSVYSTDHAQAFGVFANGGDLVKLNPILKIVDKHGNTVYEAKPERKRVADPQGVYLLNETIRNYDNYSWDGRDLAGKTGTTQNNMDAWYVGYSPDFVNICWAGNNNNSHMDYNNAWPINIVHPWCKEYLREIGESPYLAKKTKFSRPGGVYEGGGLDSCNEEGCLGIKPGWLIEGRTPSRDVVRVTAEVCEDQDTRLARPVDIAMGLSVEKEFFRYIMPIPEWQSYLDRFMSTKHGENPDENPTNGIPTEDCDIDRSGGTNAPFFTGLSANLNGSQVRIRGSAFTTRGEITGITFEIRDSTGTYQLIPGCVVTNFANFDVTCNISSLPALNSSNLSVRATITSSRGNPGTRNVNVSINTGLSVVAPYNANHSCTTPCNVSFNYTGDWTLSSSNASLYSSDGALITSSTVTSGSPIVLTIPSANSGSRFYIEVVSGNITLRSPLTGVITIP
jgi:penicillin-binding protein 1A